MTDLRYPIGPFEYDGPITDDDLARWIDEIEALPEQLRRAASGLTDAQLDTRYRPGGWTIRQVVHHLPDSHLNAYVRFKWALTEDEPTIKTYDEKRWAEQDDYRTTPVATSLDFLAALHARWAALLRTLTPDQWGRPYVHPESGPWPLDWATGQYAWHGRHHLAHVTTTIDREGWRGEPKSN